MWQTSLKEGSNSRPDDSLMVITNLEVNSAEEEAASPAGSEDEGPWDKVFGKADLATTDLVLVYDPNDKVGNDAREDYERLLARCGIRLERIVENRVAFTKIYCPFDLLCHEAEQCKLEMPLSGCEIEPDNSGMFKRFLSYFETDDEVDFVSGPFERDKLDLYEGHEDERTFFRSSLRSLLVHEMLMNSTRLEQYSVCKRLGPARPSSVISSNLPDTKRRGLPFLLMTKVYKDVFIPHDQSMDDLKYVKLKEKDPTQYRVIEKRMKTFHDARKELNTTWTKWSKFQPLWKIRNYFGEKIALYFAWQGLFLSFLWIPAIIGLSSCIYGLYESSDLMAEDVLGIIRSAFNNEFNPIFSLFICIWGTVFIEFWKRKQIVCTYEWDSNNYEEIEPDRPEFWGTSMVMDPVTKELIWIFPTWRRFRKFLVSLLVIFSMITLVFMSIAGSLAFKVTMIEKYDCPRETMNTTLPVCDTKPEYPVMCLFMATVMPAIFSAGSVLVWGQIYEILAFKLTDWENHQTQSDYNNSLTLKLFGFQFVNCYAILFYMAACRPEHHNMQVNGMFGMGDGFKDTCPQGRCMASLSFQVLLLMIAKPVLKFFQDIVWPYTKNKIIFLYEMMQLRKAVSKVQDAMPDLPSFSGLDTDSASFGPDAFHPTGSYLYHEWTKPPVEDFTLGEFTEKVIQFGYVVMFASAFPLAPFIALLVNIIDMRVDAKRLLWFNRRPIAFIASDIGMWQPIISFLNFCAIVTNAFLVSSSSIYVKNVSTETRLFIMIGFEHGLFFLMYLVLVVIPNTPSHIKMAIRRERHQVAKVLADGYLPLNPIVSRAVSTRSRTRKPSCTSNLSDEVRSYLSKNKSISRVGSRMGGSQHSVPPEVTVTQSSTM